MYADHVKYPNIADATGAFIYARLQRGKDSVPTAYPPKDIKAWASRLRKMAEGDEPAELPRVAAPAACKPAPRDVFAYVIHEGKIRAPAGAMALIEQIGKSEYRLASGRKEPALLAIRS